MIFLMTCRSSVEYSSFLGRFSKRFWDQAESIMQKARRAAVGVAKGSLNLAAVFESGIKPLALRATDLGAAYAWRVKDKCQSHPHNELLKALRALTTDV